MLAEDDAVLNKTNKENKLEITNEGKQWNGTQHPEPITIWRWDREART